MDGYDYLAGFLLLFVFFIYITWFGFSVKVENQKDKSEKISINPYDQVPFHRKLIDKKNGLVTLKDHEESIAPGQACVFYEQNSSRVLGGGWISN